MQHTIPIKFDPDAKPPTPPEVIHEDDPQKGRWGGKAESAAVG